MTGLCNHTPGPWALHQEPGAPFFGKPTPGALYVVCAGNDELLARLEGDNRANNARLIAAAPDLLAALFACITEDPGEVIAAGNARKRLQAITLTAQAAIANATRGFNRET